MERNIFLIKLKLKTFKDHLTLPLVIISIFFLSIYFLSFGKERASSEIFNSQWTTNGVSLNTENDTSGNNISDGSGGLIFVWNNSGGVRAQRLDSSGVRQWGTNGVSVSNAAAVGSTPFITGDGNGGAYILWGDDRTAVMDIYIQHINSSGSALWTANGVLLSNSAGTGSSGGDIVMDGSGGIVVTWSDGRFGSFANDIYAQRLNSSGAPLWTAGGVQINNNSQLQSYPQVARDNANNFVITWDDMRNGSNYDIYAQKINLSGAVQWTANGVLISGAADHQSTSRIIINSNNDVFVAWQDYRDVGSNIYAIYSQKINSSGVVQWASNGIEVFDGDDFDSDIFMVPDGADGFVAVWSPLRGGVNYRVVVQRINASGTALWTANGVNVSTTDSNQVWPDLALDAAGGYIVTWEDDRNGGSNYDIYAQRFDSNGNRKWGDAALAISNAAGHQFTTTVSADLLGNIFFTWYTASNPPRGQKVSIKFQISGVNSNLDVIDSNDINVESSGVNGLVGSSTTLKIKDSTDNLLLAEVVTNMNDDRDWSTLSGDSDLTNSKAFVHNLTTSPGAASTYNLYIPVASSLSTSNRVRICPATSSLNTVTTSCTDGVNFAENETKTVNGVSVTVTKTIVGGQAYWKASGVNGTGGIAYIETAETTTNNTTTTNNNTVSSGTDSDGDGLTDELEEFLGTDPNDSDTDNDGLSDGFESLNEGTHPSNLNPHIADSNNNGIGDASEDYDNDGLNNADEETYGTDPYNSDSDNDGLMDGEEVQGCLFIFGTNICSNNSFNPTDPADDDSDGDGISDSEELEEEEVEEPIPLSSDPVTDNSSNEDVINTNDENENIFQEFRSTVANSPLGNTLIELSDTEIPSTLAIVSGTTIASNAIAANKLIPYAFLWFRKRKKDRRWGIIYSRDSKKPIALAIVRAYDSENKLIDENISSLSGKYYLMIPQGKFRLEVSHPDFNNEVIEIINKSEVYNGDITLGEKDNSKNLSLVRVKQSIYNISNYIFILGFIFSLIVIMFYPSIINIFILALYIIQILFSISIKKSSTGLLFDVDTNEPIIKAFVRVYDSIDRRQIDVDITNEKGKYGIVLSKGSYEITVDAPGYELTAGKDYTIEKNAVNTSFIPYSSEKEELLKLNMAMIKGKNFNEANLGEIKPFG